MTEHEAVSWKMKTKTRLRLELDSPQNLQAFLAGRHCGWPCHADLCFPWWMEDVSVSAIRLKCQDNGLLRSAGQTRVQTLIVAKILAFLTLL